MFPPRKSPKSSKLPSTQSSDCQRSKKMVWKTDLQHENTLFTLTTWYFIPLMKLSSRFESLDHHKGSYDAWNNTVEFIQAPLMTSQSQNLSEFNQLVSLASFSNGHVLDEIFCFCRLLAEGALCILLEPLANGCFFEGMSACVQQHRDDHQICV